MTRSVRPAHNPFLRARIAGGLAARLKSERGFTLIEVLVGVVVLTVGLLPLFGAIDVANRASATDRVRQAGTSLAREVLEDARTLGYSQLVTSSLATTVQPLVPGSTVSGSSLAVTRGSYTFTVAVSACSLDDPVDGYGSHTAAPVSGGTWCPDVATSGTADTNPDDDKRVTVTVTPTGLRSTPTVEQALLIYNRDVNGPAVTCLSTTAACPGTNQTVIAGTSQRFTVTTSSLARQIQWLVNGNPPGTGQIPAGVDDPYTPTATSSNFTWNFPTADGTYTIAARSYDSSGNNGSPLSLQLTLNRHQAIPPATVTAGWNSLISGVDVTWIPSVDQDIRYYRVYHQVGTGAATLVGACSADNSTACTDLTAPTPATPPLICTSLTQSYTTANVYWVVGVDSDPTTGNPRESTSLSTKVDANLCDHRPNTPTGLSGTLSGGTMTLNWSAPSPADPDSGDSIIGWRVYRWASGTSVQYPGSRLQLVGSTDGQGHAVTTATDSSPDPAGVKQNYCVTAVDTHLNESTCSGTVTG